MTGSEVTLEWQSVLPTSTRNTKQGLKGVSHGGVIFVVFYITLIFIHNVFIIFHLISFIKGDERPERLSRNLPW